MKRYPILHPFIFGVNFVLTYFFTNPTEIPVPQVVRPLIVAPIEVGILLLLLRWVTKDWDRAGYLATLCLFLLLYYSYFYDLIVGLIVGGVGFERRLIFFILMSVLVLFLASGRVWRRLADRKAKLTQALNNIALVILILPMVGAIPQLAQLYGNPPTIKAQPPDSSVSLTGEYRPDIYYLILDGYGRSDVLEAIYGLDNSAFIDFLTEQGFYVAEASHSNYLQTELSLSSALNFDYVEELVEIVPDSANRGPLGQLIRDSRVRTMLEDNGYQIVTLATGFLVTEMRDTDVHISRFETFFNDFERALLSVSAAELVVNGLDLELPINQYTTLRNMVAFSFEQLAEVPALDGPKFVFAHILSPHPPFVFDRDGRPTQPDRRLYAGDGSHYRGTTEEYLAGYREQTLYINQLLRQTVEAILANSEEPPIIILQGDHGPGAFLSWHALEETCLWERFSILNAYYLPRDGASQLYDTITPVNSFRVIFDTYFGTQFGLTEDRAYYSTWDRPYDLIEVSDRILVPCAGRP